jgi:hypothetical protein
MPRHAIVEFMASRNGNTGQEAAGYRGARATDDPDDPTEQAASG